VEPTFSSNVAFLQAGFLSSRAPASGNIFFQHPPIFIVLAQKTKFKSTQVNFINT